MMRRLAPLLLLLLVAPLPLASAAAQIAAPAAASPGDPAARGLIETMVGEGFATLRDKSLTKAASRARFRALLQSNVALADIGDRLIRRIRIEEKITPAQYSAYQAALPEFILGAYADRLYDYDQAVVKVVRTIGRGPFTEVHTRVTRPGAQPVDAIWQVKRTPAGKLMVNNLVVSNINLTLTQEADFAAYAKKNGFDALVNFLKTSNGKRSPT